MTDGQVTVFEFQKTVPHGPESLSEDVGTVSEGQVIISEFLASAFEGKFFI